MKYSGEMLVTPPGLGKNFNPAAVAQLPNSTKGEMPRRGRLSSPATAASLSCTFPQAFGMGHCWEQETEAAQPGSSCDTWCESWLQHEEAVTAADTGEKKALKNACTLAPLNGRDRPHQAALGALTVLLGTPVPFPTPISAAATWWFRVAGTSFPLVDAWNTTGYLLPRVFFPKTCPGLIWCLQNT